MRQILPQHADTHKIGGSDPVEGIFYGVAVHDFVSTIAANDTTTIPYTDAEGDVITGVTTVGMTIEGGRIHVPNVMGNGGFYHVFAGVDTSTSFGAGVDELRSASVLMSVYDSAESVVAASFGALWDRRTWWVNPDSSAAEYRYEGLFWNKLVSSPATAGWHHHFQTYFLNPTASQGNLVRGHTAILRYGKANTQIAT